MPACLPPLGAGDAALSDSSVVNARLARYGISADFSIADTKR
jgi:hypothetical protein